MNLHKNESKTENLGVFGEHGEPVANQRSMVVLSGMSKTGLGKDAGEKRKYDCSSA